jgi:tetratricopeptide (TPR) repeat protein
VRWRAENAPRALAGLLVFVLAAAVYAGTVGHTLVWDDEPLTALVAGRVQAGGVPALLAAEFRLEEDLPTGYYRPLVLLTLWVVAALFHSSPTAYHARNVLLHATASLLVYALLLAAFGSLPGALAGGALFAAHPAHVESVAFVSGRTDVLCAVFLLLSTLLWVRVRHGAARKAGVERLASLAAFALACLAKETAFVLPAALLLWELCDSGTGAGAFGARARRAWPWLLGWVAVLAAVLLLRAALGIPLGSGGAGDGAGAERIVARAAEYARLLLVPWPLNAWYTPSQVRLSPLNAACVLALLAAGVLAAGAPLRRAGIKGLAWAAVFIVPALGLVGYSSAEIAERFLYIPSVGYAMVVAGLAARAESSGRRARALAFAALALLAALFAAGTVLRARVWRDEETFFRAMTLSSPDAKTGYHGLGRALAARRDYGGAIASYREALAREPSARTHFNLGNAYAAIGLLEQAAASYQEALRIRPDYPEAHNNLALVLADQRRLDEAVAHYRESLRLRPGHANTLFNLGSALALQGRVEEAAESYRAALRANPDLAPAREALRRLEERRTYLR